ncbi:MAG: hypothetical protein IJ628_05330 [Bacteroidaceae bacterium]|nr:hypothetical protein [Bacteroidaceae bacterium]
MNKKYLSIMAAAAMLTACSDDLKEIQNAPEVAKTPTEEVTPAVEEMPVSFGAYVNRATTRAGETGIMTAGEWDGAANAWTDIAGSGFGVFGYYTNNNDYDPQATPNFFYNQLVSRNNATGTPAAADGWYYDPVKYWPNEFGDALSDDNDKVTYFAYAPYVEVVPSTGKLVKVNADDDKWGITGLSRNSATGDPLVKYIASFDQAKSVDLLWGTVGTASTQWNIINTPTAVDYQHMDEGMPWMNVLRPSQTSQKLSFDFKHALAQLSVDVDAFVDGTDNSTTLDSKTRIYIRSISFTGFAMKGSLNLNNTETGAGKAYWLDYNGTADLENGEPVLVYDGRKDGKEGASGAIASNEKVLGLNPQFIQTENSVDYTATPKAWAAAGPAGVTNTPASLFREETAPGVYTASTSPIMVIPSGDEMEVEIIYDVETIDPQLANYVSDAKTPGSSIENRIHKTVKFGDSGMLENGKHYTLHLHLGMNSVKLDATVSPWVDAPSQAEVDLPLNVPAFAAAAAGSPATNVYLTATQDKYEFAITALNGGESVTAPAASGNFSAPTDNAANSSGTAIQSVTVAANNTIFDTAPVNLTWTGAASGKEVQLAFIQKAHALGLKVGTANTFTAGVTIDLTTTGFTIPASGANWFKDSVSDPSKTAKIVVKKNGTALTKVGTFSASPANEFKLDYNTGKISLGIDAVAGDIFEITVRTGDAPEETITVKAV